MSRESCSFGSKTTEHSVWCVQVSSQITHHEMGKHVQKVFQKNPLKPNSASHNNASYYTDTDGILQHSHSGGSLYYQGPTTQKIIPFLGRVTPLYSFSPSSLSSPSCFDVINFSHCLISVPNFAHFPFAALCHFVLSVIKGEGKAVYYLRDLAWII